MNSDFLKTCIDLSVHEEKHCTKNPKNQKENKGQRLAEKFL